MAACAYGLSVIRRGRDLEGVDPRCAEPEPVSRANPDRCGLLPGGQGQHLRPDTVREGLVRVRCIEHHPDRSVAAVLDRDVVFGNESPRGGVRKQLHSEIAKDADLERPLILSGRGRMLPGDRPDGKGHTAGSRVRRTGRSEAEPHRRVGPRVEIGTRRLHRGPPGSGPQRLDRDSVDDTADVADADLAFCFRTWLDFENAGVERYCDSVAIAHWRALALVRLWRGVEELFRGSDRFPPLVCVMFP